MPSSASSAIWNSSSASPILSSDSGFKSVTIFSILELISFISCSFKSLSGNKTLKISSLVFPLAPFNTKLITWYNERGENITFSPLFSSVISLNRLSWNEADAFCKKILGKWSKENFYLSF